jgi:CRISPR-associated protein Csd1
MVALLNQPWAPKDAAFRLDDFAFYLAVLSPNVGRIAVRDWLAVGIETAKRSLAAFVEATRMVTAWGQEAHPASVATMNQAIGATGADLERALLRCAYTGTRPPGALAIRAGQRMGQLLANEHGLRERERTRTRERAPVWRDEWPHALAAAIKLGLFYGKEEMPEMAEANKKLDSRAYHAGRLLAMLDRAQQAHYRDQNGEWPKEPTVQRGYGGGASAPAPFIGRLFQLATVAWLPKAGWLYQEIGEVSATLAEQGGLPSRLTATEQAAFGLGFYQERARLRAGKRVDASSGSAPDAADAAPADDRAR